MTSQGDEPEKMPEKSFLEHLDDLRRTILWSLAALAGGIAIAIPLAPSVLRAIKAPLRQVVQDPDSFLRILEISGGFDIAMRVVLWTGLLVSSPLIFFFIGMFIFPGLKRRERHVIVGAALCAVALFTVGVTMGYFLTLPVALKLMLGVSTWIGVQVEFVTLTSYVKFVLQILIAFGVTFELPMIVIVLGTLGIVSSRQLRDKRRHVIVGLFVVATVLTPPDVFSQLLMAIPLVALFELSIWIVWLRERRRSS